LHGQALLEVNLPVLEIWVPVLWRSSYVAGPHLVWTNQYTETQNNVKYIVKLFNQLCFLLNIFLYVQTLPCQIIYFIKECQIMFLIWFDAF